MFLNPQSALPLPPHPSLERYKKLAKQLTAGIDDPHARRDWRNDWSYP